MPVTWVKPDPPRLAEGAEDVEKIPASDPRSSAVWINPVRVSSVACFCGTRVPLQVSWDHLEEGPSMDDFPDGFPGVTHEQAKAALRLALEELSESLPESTPWR